MRGRARLHDLAGGVRHWPGSGGWGHLLIEAAWSLPLILILAHLGGLARFQSPPDITTSLALAATLFVAPALGEELLFRGLLIPRSGPRAAWAALSVLLFILWHPLQAVTIGPPWSAAFLDPWFLGAVAVLGVALARLYGATRSIWPGVILHWVVVFGWKAFFGGPF